MGTRLELHDILLGIVPEAVDEESHAYYQPPESIKIVYPCVVYERAKINATHANNGTYTHKTRYQVTAISSDPDSTWHLDILKLPLCAHVRSFVMDGLYHDVFELYF
jgi:hypothetical protein